MTNTPTPARPALDAMAEEIERLDKLATAAPWQAMREGNQYVDCKKIEPTLIATSRVHGVKRPWNPYAATQFGLTPEHHESVRFKDDDADLVAYLRNNAPALVAALRSLADMRGAIDILGFGTAKDAWLNLFGASEDLSNTNGNDEITKRTVARVLQQLAEVRAALARSAP